jgi:hypothetical protein
VRRFGKALRNDLSSPAHRRTSAELLIDCEEEDLTLLAVLVGMLREVNR